MDFNYAHVFDNKIIYDSVNLKKINSYLVDCKFFARNLCKSSKIPAIKPARAGSSLILGLRKEFHGYFNVFLRDIEGSPRCSLKNHVLYNLIGKKLIFLAFDTDHKSESFFVTAVNIYYFNDFDAAHGLGTVHEAFIGVHNERRGKGLATEIREAAYAHFKHSSLFGITTRIKKDNYASIVSAEKLGFSIPDAFQGYQHVDDELYMIRSL